MRRRRRTGGVAAAVAGPALSGVSMPQAHFTSRVPVLRDFQILPTHTPRLRPKHCPCRRRPPLSRPAHVGPRVVVALPCSFGGEYTAQAHFTSRVPG
jgi:hypothetical protein